MVVLIAIALLVVFIVWWATLWAPREKSNDNVDAGVDKDAWPPAPKR